MRTSRVQVSPVRMAPLGVPGVEAGWAAALWRRLQASGPQNGGVFLVRHDEQHSCATNRLEVELIKQLLGAMPDEGILEVMCVGDVPMNATGWQTGGLGGEGRAGRWESGACEI